MTQGTHYTIRVANRSNEKTYFVTGQGLQLSLPMNSRWRYESRVKADAAYLRAAMEDDRLRELDDANQTRGRGGSD